MPPKPKVKTGGKPEDVWKRDKGQAKEEEEDERGWSDEDNNGKKGRGKKADKKKAQPEPEPEPVVKASGGGKKKKEEPVPLPIHLRPKDPVVSAPAAAAVAPKKKDEPKPAPAVVVSAAPIAATQASSSHDKTSVCRLKLAGSTFEALCHSNKIKEFREGKCSLQHVLADQDSVYRNASRGERYSAKELEQAFETSNVLEMLERIVQKGQAQVTAEEIKEDVERKRREVISYLATKFVDPKTGRPHPPTRIESALDTMRGLVFDPKRSAADHSADLVKKIIASGLPMKKLEMEGQVIVNKQLHAATQQVLIKMGVSITSTSFTADLAKISVGINPNDLDHMNKELAKVTQGDFSFELPDHHTLSSVGGKH
ncbi:SBDS family rRNA metabolism protein [Batrachochytrium salamandrivorans]|nr:SBDS family rRNA metabolism protein [Batrachochytrium salamandrivorans]